MCATFWSGESKGDVERSGSSDKVDLDEGIFSRPPFALKELTAAEKANICALLKKAVS